MPAVPPTVMSEPPTTSLDTLRLPTFWAAEMRLAETVLPTLIEAAAPPMTTLEPEARPLARFSVPRLLPIVTRLSMTRPETDADLTAPPVPPRMSSEPARRSLLSENEETPPWTARRPADIVPPTLTAPAEPPT